jgi:two-component system NarL family sensor kinase
MARARNQSGSRAQRHVRRLTAQLIDAEELERKRLARFLHDYPMQDLAAALLALKRIEGDTTPALGEAREGIERAIDRLRRAVFDLYPSVVDQLGLQAAVGDLAAEIEARSEISIACEIATDATGAHDQMLFSLARELLLNAERHAQPRSVAIRITRSGGELVLEVEDDGNGFPLARLYEARRHGHIGLASGIERVEALGGTLSIRSQPGAGTTVRVALPARRAADRAQPCAAA